MDKALELHFNRGPTRLRGTRPGEFHGKEVIGHPDAIEGCPMYRVSIPDAPKIRPVYLPADWFEPIGEE